MLILTASRNITKAQAANSQAAAFASLVPLISMPTGDGVFDLGTNGGEAENRAFCVPYCDGGAGAMFSFRVYGWRVISHPDGGVNGMVWFPYFIAEFLCTSSNLHGPNDPNPRMIGTNEYLCDTITLTQGSLGKDGSINSTGPGSDLIAYAMVDLTGARKIQFDFSPVDPVAMNLLWAFA